MDKKKKAAVGIGLVSAITASLCCVTPLVALVAGVGGAASALSWMEPLRPYMMGITLLALGFAWFQQFRRRNTASCDCEDAPTRSFFQTTTFLGIVTFFAALVVSFPYYGHALYSDNSSDRPSNTAAAEMKTMNLEIIGMTARRRFRNLLITLRLLSNFSECTSR